MRLLIAEDEQDLAEALTVFFERNHFSVDAVHDGLSALDYAESGAYDAIILDVMMPGMDGVEVLRFSSFPVSEVLTETALSFSEAAEAHGTPLSLLIEPGISFTGDEYAVRQLASILLDNAVKYARSGDPVFFSLKKTEKGVEIDCENACSPIPSQELPRLFDRFYRADKARTAGGYGVGLSIARSIAEAHHGSIRATCPQEDRILFQAILCG